ncbi:ATP-binding protein [Kitasatospora sp. NPDC052896]|uniref:ATP-binding protein n=1 Tax=Kitasatospora sp. NPDC052896 TaxID=3364061 RepID=UPI0037C65EAE
MMQHMPEAVTWGLGAGLLVTVVLLLRQRAAGRALARSVRALEEAVRVRDEEAHRLATVRLPALAAGGRPAPLPASEPVHPRLHGTPFARDLRAVVEQFDSAVDRAQQRADQSAKAALKGAMRALQGLANEQQVAISEMQERHDRPEVLHDLLQVDHANSQFGRRAQAIAVLCGSWPGRQRAASALSDVVRGAKSRIRDYRRVEVRTQIELAVVSRAVEPVVLSVAELLDNAARHSQPNTTVEVNLQPAHNGACIVIDDAGVGMDPREARQAGELLSGQRLVDVTRLGDPPQFGFAVIGVLAARYGFSVSVDTRSPYGGVRAVLFLPSALLTQPEAAGVPSVPSPGRHAAPAGPTPVPSAEAARTTGGLPRRRRREPLPEAAAAEYAPDAPGRRAPDAPAHEPVPDWTADAETTARRLGAFARGTRAGRAPDESTGPFPG